MWLVGTPTSKHIRLSRRLHNELLHDQ